MTWITNFGRRFIASFRKTLFGFGSFPPHTFLFPSHFLRSLSFCAVFLSVSLFASITAALLLGLLRLPLLSSHMAEPERAGRSQEAGFSPALRGSFGLTGTFELLGSHAMRLLFLSFHNNDVGQIHARSWRRFGRLFAFCCFTAFLAPCYLLLFFSLLVACCIGATVECVVGSLLFFWLWQREAAALPCYIPPIRISIAVFPAFFSLVRCAVRHVFSTRIRANDGHATLLRSHGVLAVHKSSDTPVFVLCRFCASGVD